MTEHNRVGRDYASIIWDLREEVLTALEGADLPEKAASLVREAKSRLEEATRMRDRLEEMIKAKGYITPRIWSPQEVYAVADTFRDHDTAGLASAAGEANVAAWRAYSQALRALV